VNIAIALVSKAMQNVFGRKPIVQIISREVQRRNICGIYSYLILWLRSFNTFEDVQKIYWYADESLEDLVAEVRSYVLTLFMKCIEINAPTIYRQFKTHFLYFFAYDEPDKTILKKLLQATMECDDLPTVDTPFSPNVRKFIADNNIELPIGDVMRERPLFTSPPEYGFDVYRG